MKTNLSKQNGKRCIAGLCILCTLLSFNLYSQNLSLKGYGKLGFLLTPPNTADLGFSLDGNPGGLDDLQDVKCLIYGLGFKAIMPYKNQLSFGGDIGFQNLFNSRVNNELLSNTYYNYHIDKEWEMYLNAIVQYKKEDSPWFFEGGPGLHLIFWNSEYHYSSIYDDVDNYYDGTEVRFGICGEAGRIIETGKGFSIPVSIRSDLIIRYGVLWQIAATVGIEF